MKHVMAKHIEITKDGYLTIDAVTLPWYLGPDWSLMDLSGGDNALFGLTLTFLTDRVTLTSNDFHIDTEMEKARREAINIVRAGLADVIDWCGYTPDDDDEGYWAGDAE